MVITAWVISLLAILLTPILLIRFRKRWVAAFNLAITNRITGRFAARLPGFGILTHVGRKSSRLYRTPGPDSEWVRNVLAAVLSLKENGRLTGHSKAPALCEIPLVERKASAD
jgi:hypothetical protein